MPEEYLAPLSGKGTKGSSFLDITADHPDYGRLRINTVDVLKDGVTPTKRDFPIIGKSLPNHHEFTYQ